MGLPHLSQQAAAEDFIEGLFFWFPNKKQTFLRRQLRCDIGSLPTVQDFQLLRRVEPVLSILHDGQITGEALHKAIHLLPWGQIVLTGIQDGCRPGPALYGVRLGILVISPGKGLSKTGLDGLPGFQIRFCHACPLHHAPDQLLHVQDWGHKQALFQWFLLERQHTEPGPDAVGPQGDPAPVCLGVFHDSLKFRHNVPRVKGAGFPLAAAMLRQIDPQHLPAAGTYDLGEVLCFFLAAAFSVDKQIELVRFCAVQNGGYIHNLE